MAKLQAPIINWQVKSAKSIVGFSDQRVLLIGQGSGSAVAKKVIKNVTLNEASHLLGMGSMTYMAYNRFRKYNKDTIVDVIPLKEPTSGKQAKGSITTTGTATESKNIKFYVVDDEYHITIAVSKGDTGEIITGKIVEAITSSSVPCEAKVASTKTIAEIEFKIKGTIGNGLTFTLNERVAGITFGLVAMKGGSGVYDSNDILNGQIERYQTVIFDDTMDYDAVREWLEGRFNQDNAVNGGIGFIVKPFVNVVGATNFFDDKNSKVMVVFGNIANSLSYNMIPLLAVAEFAAKRSLRLTEGAVLSDLVVEPQEVYGGISKASLPYHNTPMSYRKSDTHMELGTLKNLNKSGLSMFVPATNGTVLGSVVTTYKTDNTGSADATFKYLNAVDTALAVQEYFYNNCERTFGQTRATRGDLVSGVAMTNALSVKSYIVGLYVNLIDLALVQGSSDAIKSFQKNTTVTLEAETGTYNVYAPVAIVSQFRQLNGVVAISYNFK